MRLRNALEYGFVSPSLQKEEKMETASVLITALLAESIAARDNLGDVCIGFLLVVLFVIVTYFWGRKYYDPFNKS